jgi:hypothetical protein
VENVFWSYTLISAIIRWVHTGARERRVTYTYTQ